MSNIYSRSNVKVIMTSNLYVILNSPRGIDKPGLVFKFWIHYTSGALLTTRDYTYVRSKVMLVPNLYETLPFTKMYSDTCI